jgi:hypothetical protein
MLDEIELFYNKINLMIRQRSLSAKNLHERVYDTLPKSLKAEVLVKSKIEDPEIREERRKLTQVINGIDNQLNLINFF